MKDQWIWRERKEMEMKEKEKEEREERCVGVALAPTHRQGSHDPQLNSSASSAQTDM